MVNIVIDGTHYKVDENLTILQAAKEANIDIPTLCYLEGFNEIGACRLCVVEVAGMDRLVASCNTRVQEGMVVATQTDKVWITRKINTELILSKHDCRCAKCSRSGNCVLQKIANDFGLLKNCVLQNLANGTGTLEVSFPKMLKNVKWNQNFPLIRDETRCVTCMRCIQVCEKMQNIGVWDMINTGSRTTVSVSDNRNIEASDCVLCGQCITHCPVGALWARDDSEKVFAAISDPEKITIVQVSPAVRAAWGEGLGLTDAQATEKRFAAVLRNMGFDYVFQVDFSTDLLIMETSAELLERLQSKDAYKFPLFTSFCPSWLRFMQRKFPEMTEHLSKTKSPQQMLGTMVKRYYAEQLDIDAEKLFCVSITSCLAKKSECAATTDHTVKPVDVSLTTNELVRMIKTAGIKVRQIPEEDFDQPLGMGSSSAVIVDTAGGLAVSTLHTLHYLLTGRNPQPGKFTITQRNLAWQEAAFEINGITIKTAAVSGLGNTNKLMKHILAGRERYDFVEVMACPGGCVGGGGQPIHEGCEYYDNRSQILHAFNLNHPLQFSHDNTAVQNFGRQYLDYTIAPQLQQKMQEAENK